MFRRTSIAAASLAFAFLWLTSQPVSASQTSTNTWSGTWQTAWTGGGATSAAMNLTQSGNSVTGTYDHLTGRIFGEVTGTTFAGTWSQSNSTGPFSFTLTADGHSWAGTWSDKSGGGNWHGSCSNGACLHNAAAITTPPTTPTRRPSATVVVCNRDTTITSNAHFSCSALVSDDGVPVLAPAPTGTVHWSSIVGSFSPESCVLQLATSGVPSCAVDYDASNQDVPTQTGVPRVTANYSGDDVYTPSHGSPKVITPAAPSGGVPIWLLGLGGAAVAAGAAAAITYAKRPTAPRAAQGLGPDSYGTDLDQPPDPRVPSGLGPDSYGTDLDQP